ncbi:MAG: hypothetical protein ACLQUY_06755 [Ktedonobacterales bacterium]
MHMAQSTAQSFMILGHVVTVHGIETADTLAQRLDELLGPSTVAIELPSSHSTKLMLHREESEWHVTDESSAALCPPLYDEAQVASCLEWQAYTASVRYSCASLVLHAGAVTRHGGAVLLPNVSGAGKTTLTLALAARGWLPLTDDVCPLIEREGELVAVGCRRACHLAVPTLAILRDIGVELEGPVGGLESYYRPRHWGEPAAVRSVVIPRYVENAATNCVPITQAECLTQLLNMEFAQESPSPGERRRLAVRLATRVKPFSLTYSSLPEALDMFETLEAQLDIFSPAGERHW